MRLETQSYQTVRIRERKVSEEDPVHDAEDGAVGADSEPEGEDGNDGEDRISPESPEGVPGVHSEVLDHSDSPGFPGLFFMVFGFSEVPPGFPGRFLRWHAFGHELLGFHLQVEFHFLLHRMFHMTREQSRSDAEEPLKDETHEQCLRRWP